MQKLGEVTTTLIIKIDEETKQAFKKACDGQMSETVRSLIEQYLKGGKVARRTAKHK